MTNVTSLRPEEANAAVAADAKLRQQMEINAHARTHIFSIVEEHKVEIDEFEATVQGLNVEVDKLKAKLATQATQRNRISWFFGMVLFGTGIVAGLAIAFIRMA